MSTQTAAAAVDNYLSINNIEVIYDHVILVLKGVSLNVPKGKIVVLGLVTTKLGQLESKDDLKRRIDEAAKYAPLDQLCISPQCGFSSTVHSNTIAVQAQRDKLRLVVEVAQEVWG